MSPTRSSSRTVNFRRTRIRTVTASNCRSARSRVSREANGSHTPISFCAIPTTNISQPDPTTMMSTVTTPDGLSTVKSTRTDGTASYVAPNQVAYSSRQSNPDGSSAYWQTANDGVSGVRSPFVSSRLDFMGSTTDPVRTTSSTRSPSLSDPSDLSSVSSFSQTDSVNGRATVLSYSKASQTFTTTTLAGRTTTRQVDAFGRTASFQVGISRRPHFRTTIRAPEREPSS